jgi:hypothetical protein
MSEAGKRFQQHIQCTRNALSVNEWNQASKKPVDSDLQWSKIAVPTQNFYSPLRAMDSYASE